MFHTKVVEKQNTQFRFNNVFFSNRAVYVIMWKNIVEPDRPQMTTWRLHVARCLLRLQMHSQNM